jgi:hypothetical protein
MSGKIDWKGCIGTMQAKTVTPDTELINYLVDSSSNRRKTAKMIPLNETTKESVISLMYDSLRELLEALSIKEGFKIYNHECYTQFLISVVKDEELAREFDSARLLRNRLNYYGRKIPLNDAKYRIISIDKLISKVGAMVKI